MATQKLPPQNLEVEQSVLSAILIDPDAIIKVADILSPESFYDTSHRNMYEAMRQLYEKRQPIDAVTLTNQLKKNKTLSNSGGAAAVARLSTIVSTAGNVLEYAKIVADLAIKRRLISLSGELSQQAFDDGVDAAEVLNQAEQQVFAISHDTGSQSFTSVKDTLVESFERLDELQRTGGEIRGVPTGFADLDRLLAGMQRSNLIILAARPGIGKTAFALNLAHHVAVVAKQRIGIFSLEMSREELVDRLLVTQADIDAWRLKTGRLDQQDFLKLSDAMGVLADARIYIDDTPGLSIFEMRTRARRLMMEHGIDIIVVDYLQLAQGRSKENRVQEVGEISQGLKNIARELKVPVLALSQLSRAIESRGERVPQLSDLRESGCVTGDTLVTLADSGLRVPIADLVGKKGFEVFSLNTKTHQIERSLVSNAFPTGKKQVYEMVTKLGKRIRATANHKFFTIECWKRLDELKVGEHIAIPREVKLNIKSSDNARVISDDQLALLAHLIGDGCTLPRHSIQYTTKEIEIAEIVSSLSNKVFGDAIQPRIHKEKNWYQVYLSSTRKLTHGVRSVLSTWLHELGAWGLRSYEKFIPEIVFAQSDESIALFLRHLWSTDGCVRMAKIKERLYPKIYYASSSKRLANDVQSLLVRLGILSRIKIVSQKGKGRDQYHVLVSGAPDIRTFINRVGAVGTTRNDRLKKISRWADLVSTNTNRDIIPAHIWSTLIKPWMLKQGLSYRTVCDLTESARSGAMFRQNLGRERALKIAQAIKLPELKQLATSQTYWDAIVSIEVAGIEEVFDLTVPGHANFIANDIVIHNSIEQDADVVMFLYRKDEDIRESVNLRIAKHRNGALGEIDLYFKGDRIRFYGMETRRDVEQ